MRRFLLSLLPRRILSAFREWRDLPRAARRHWLRALGKRSLSWDITKLPEPLATFPRVLFVCHGNIYRSPAAAVAFAEEVWRRGFPVGSIRSAGIRASANSAAPDDAIDVGARLGIPLKDHRSTPLSPELIAESDLIVIMDRRNEALLAAMDPAAIARTVLLGAFDSEVPNQPAIDDPYGRGPSAIESAYLRIQRSVNGLIDALARVSADSGSSGRSGVGARLRHAVQSALASPPLLPLWAPSRRSSASILMLHRFANPDLGVLGHDPHQLTKNLEFLRRQRFFICSLSALVARLAEGEPPEPNTLVFTVDDGYRDFAEIGAPIFQRYDIPVTTFLVTSFVAEARWLWYDVLRYCASQHLSLSVEIPIVGRSFLLQWRNSVERRLAIRRLISRLHRTPTEEVEQIIATFPELLGVSLPDRPTPRFAPMTWSEVQAWEKRGMLFGPHTHTHPILSQSTEQRVQREIAHTWDLVQQHVEAPTAVLCYPSGMPADFTEREQDLVRAAGLKAAVAAFGGRASRVRSPRDLFTLPRIAYEASDAGFRWQVAGAPRTKNKGTP